MRTAMNPRRSLCLMHADERAIPFPTLKAFAGSRHAAIQRRDWNDIHIDAGILRAPEKKSSRSNSAYSAPAVREPGACGHPPPSGMVFPDVDDGEHGCAGGRNFIAVMAWLCIAFHRATPA